MGWLIGAAAAAFALFLLYHSKLELATRLTMGEEKQLNTTLLLLGGAVRLRANISLIRNESGQLQFQFRLNDKPKPMPKRKQQKDKPKAKAAPTGLSPKARQFAIRHVNLRSLGVSMTIGVANNAALTAQLCGLALTVLESASAVIRALKPRARVLMRAAARYNSDCLRLRLSCIASIKIGHLMIIAAMIAANQAKGAFKQWLTRLKMSCVPPWKTSRI